MSIVVNIISSNTMSDEYVAAKKLKSIIENTTPKHVIGEIVLLVSATLYGQNVKDVDLVMCGNIQNYFVDCNFVENNVEVCRKVRIDSFCTTIEIKSHDISGITRIGTDIYVKYKENLHSVTEQSNNQKYSLLRFLEHSISVSPYITNLIWFTDVTPLELRSILNTGSGLITSNVIASTFKFDDVIRLLCLQQKPKLYRGDYLFDSNGNISNSAIKNALNLFSARREGCGELTRKRIEQICNNKLSSNIIVNNGETNIIRGKAGTGKTVNLIQTAIKIVDEYDSRALILTYNKALVSDIKRLFALSNLPDYFNNTCVSISTLHSYFFKLINVTYFENGLDINFFLDNYSKILEDFYEFITSDLESLQYVKNKCKMFPEINWEYLLIDEAQDCEVFERNILITLFEKSKIFIADGGNQFVRHNSPCDWNCFEEKNNIKLKVCLRQKSNINKFLRHLCNKCEYEYSIKESDKMIGGKIIILTDNSKLYTMHNIEKEKMLEKGNVMYDMMYLVPHQLVKNADIKEFSLKEDFRRHNISFWDGTNDVVRNEYSTKYNEVRVLQYDSARGLEGWTVVCLNFDQFVQNKMSEYVPNNNVITLESPEELEKKYLMNWILLALTRAIDTLVISFLDIENPISKKIINVASELNDYVEII